MNSHTQTFDQTQTFKQAGICRTADDVRARAAETQAFRARVWPLQRPAASPRPAPVRTVEARPPGRIMVRRVLEVTAEHFSTTVEALVSDSRKRPLVRQRQIAMYVAHQLTGRGLVFIGDKMGGRDHTTVLHGVRAVKALLDAGDADTVEAVNAIVETLQNSGRR
jgi:hypothetical protein